MIRNNLSNTRNKRVFNTREWKQCVLHMNIPRSKIHESEVSVFLIHMNMENKRVAHEYISFFNPWTDNS